MKLEFSNAEECYELNFDGYNQNETYFLSCLIYTKVAEIFYMDENKEILYHTISMIKNGSFIHTIRPSRDYKKYICIRFPNIEPDKYDFDEIFYSLQLTDPKQSDTKINL